MTVILKETHEEAIRKIKKRSFKIHVLGICFTFLLSLFLMCGKVILKIEKDLAKHSYEVVRSHVVEMRTKLKLLEILRTKPISIGHALEIADVVFEESRNREIPIPMVLAIIDQESSYRNSVTSEKGARGLMQLMPGTWNQYMNDPKLKKETGNSHIPTLNIRAGMAYLGDLTKKEKDWNKVLSVYVSGNRDIASNQVYIKQVFNKAKEYSEELGGRW
ncbi:MAG: lytic transglycosylase domain-containing protein [Syntrophaceae bacterium]|nr:lytic transglycosylase domain-containing protein [Syntrophaceae bacterium]